MSAINTLTPRVSGVYFLKSGQQRDVFGLQDLHPNSNINKLEIYLEDGDGKNTVFINFRNDKKSAITSHWFPTIFMGYVNHTLIGEEIPRTFAKYVLFVSTMVTKWNLNGHAPLPISSTVVQVGGDRLIGLFGTLNDLNNEYNQSQKEKLYLNNKVAYVYEENNNYGFYKLILDRSNYVWTKIDNPLDAYNIVDTKQYNVLGLTIQKGNAPTVKSQITISDEYIRFILSTLAEIKDTLIMVESDLGDKDGGAVGGTAWGEINYLLYWLDKIMTDSSIISYDNQDSGLTATNIKDAIDELEDIMFKKDGSVKATGDFELNNKGIYDVSQISVGEINAQTQGGFIDVNDEIRFYEKTQAKEAVTDNEVVVKKQLDKKLNKSGGTMTGDLDMAGNDISYVKELQVEKVTTGGGYSIEIEDDIDMRDNIIENVDIVKFAYGLQIQRSADKKEIRFYVPRTGGYGLIFKIVDGELRLHDGVKITNLADGTHIKDAVTKGQLDLKADQSTTYTKNEVNNLISQIPKFKIIKVSVLPTENIDLMAIYVLGNAEYIYIENETRWEKLGTLEVDLNDYYDKTEIANLLLGKVNTTRTINSKALTANIVLNATDVGARASTWTPTWSDVNDKPSWIGASKPTYTYAEIGGTKPPVDADKTPELKTINGETIIGTGDIVIAGGGETPTYSSMTQAQIDTGTSTTSMVISPKLLKDNLNNKVDKVAGKVLSTNDYTTAEKNLVATITNKANTTDVNAGLALKVNIAGNVTITGTKDFTGTLLYGGEEVATMQDLSTVFKYKGSVETYDDLPASGQQIGDVYNVNDTGKNYAWSGTLWDDLGGTVDLSIYVTKTELTSGLSGKVDKVTGMGLSTNDFTTAEKTKLNGIAANAQVNVLEGVKLNGTDVAISGKKSNIVVNKTTVGLSNVKDVDTTNPANITQSATHRFVSDTEKSTWNGKQNALGFTPENVTNKVTTITASSTNTQYPTAKAVYDMIGDIETALDTILGV